MSTLAAAVPSEAKPETLTLVQTLRQHWAAGRLAERRKDHTTAAAHFEAVLRLCSPREGASLPSEDAAQDGLAPQAVDRATPAPASVAGPVLSTDTAAGQAAQADGQAAGAAVEGAADAARPSQGQDSKGGGPVTAGAARLLDRGRQNIDSGAPSAARGQEDRALGPGVQSGNDGCACAADAAAAAAQATGALAAEAGVRSAGDGCSSMAARALALEAASTEGKALEVRVRSACGARESVVSAAAAAARLDALQLHTLLEGGKNVIEQGPAAAADLAARLAPALLGGERQTRGGHLAGDRHTFLQALALLQVRRLCPRCPINRCDVATNVAAAAICIVTRSM